MLGAQETTVKSIHGLVTIRFAKFLLVRLFGQRSCVLIPKLDFFLAPFYFYPHIRLVQP